MAVALFSLDAMSQAALNQAVLVMLSLTASGEITKEADRNREGMVLGSISRLFDANGCASLLSSVFVSVSVSVTIDSISYAATRWALYTARQAVLVVFPNQLHCLVVVLGQRTTALYQHLFSRTGNAEDVVGIRFVVTIIDALFVFCSLASCAVNTMLLMELHQRRM